MPHRHADLALELKLVMREAARNPEALEGRLPILTSFRRVVEAVPDSDDGAAVHFVLTQLIPEYLGRMPTGSDCNAIRELLSWETADGTPQTLTARYERAEAFFERPPSDFGRRQEPRLLQECARRFIGYDHDDALARNGHSVQPGAHLDADLSPMATLLWDHAVAAHERLLSAIREGTISVIGQDGLHEMLALLSEAADESLHAIDHIDLPQWFESDGLQEYLGLQMEKARNGVAVERIRMVRDNHLADPGQVDLLRRFVDIHDEAGATLLLCPERLARRQKTVFFPRMGMLLTDRASRPACLLGQLGGNGVIERSLVYLRPAEPLRVASDDFERLRKLVVESGRDRELRKKIARPDAA